MKENQKNTYAKIGLWTKIWLSDFGNFNYIFLIWSHLENVDIFVFGS